MDKIILSNDDFKRLCAWGKNHKKEHSRMLSEQTFPIKALKIELPFCNFIIKGFIDDKGMKIAMNFSGKSLGSCYLEFQDGYAHCVKDTIHKGLSTEFKQDICWIFTYVLLLMLHGNDFPRMNSYKQRKTVSKPKNNKPTSVSNKSNTKSDSVVYLLRFDKRDEPHIVTHGHHASPSHSFSVRGHFRHYKNGKVVWIDNYEKGRKSKKDKVYKI
ncbi:MAG: hypothetical protein IJ341_01740 [Bacteroidales bacterium]|nr:hypothetical protein [Bacteroidales bacterium]